MRTRVSLVTTKGTNHYINHMAKPRFDQDANRGYFIEAFETLILEKKKKEWHQIQWLGQDRFNRTMNGWMTVDDSSSMEVVLG